VRSRQTLLRLIRVTQRKIQAFRYEKLSIVNKFNPVLTAQVVDAGSVKMAGTLSSGRQRRAKRSCMKILVRVHRL